MLINGVRDRVVFMFGIALTFSFGVFGAQSKAKGPEAIAKQDPTRIVATIDGQQITARQAMAMFSKVAPPVRNQYTSRLPTLLKQLYMQGRIAEEATKLHLDQKMPWKRQLATTRMRILQGVMNYPSEPEKDMPPEAVAQWHGARDKILWNAYFSQAPTKEENQALLKKEQDRYAIHVQDPDFFNGVTN
jgi:hypothetical protein